METNTDPKTQEAPDAASVATALIELRAEASLQRKARNSTRAGIMLDVAGLLEDTAKYWAYRVNGRKVPIMDPRAREILTQNGLESLIADIVPRTFRGRVTE